MILAAVANPVSFSLCESMPLMSSPSFWLCIAAVDAATAAAPPPPAVAL